MATKAEVEKTAKHMWNRVAKPIAKKIGMPDGDTTWNDLQAVQREGWLVVARWHLGKVAEAFEMGRSAGRHRQ